MMILRRSFLLALFLVAMSQGMLCSAQIPPSVHVEGRNIVDTHGNKVVMHGVMDTPNAYFNSNRWGACTDANIPACINYFNQLFTAITDTTQGAHCTVFRLHLDPCWTNDPNLKSDGKESGEADISRFSKTRLQTYFTSLYWKIIARGLQHGLHVVVRPPGVCPKSISVGGDYQKYLMTVWDVVSSNLNMKRYAGQVSIELANEPIGIVDSTGKSTASAMRDFFQPIVNKIRANGFTGIIWVPGTGWQSNYKDYAAYPIEGYNIGYAVHAYVGWYGCSDDNATGELFLKNFTESVPVVKTNPVIVTEIDWSPENPNATGHYDEHGNWVQPNYGTWATGSTSKWGKAFKYAKDQLGNVSMTLTGTSDLIDIDTYLKEGKVVAAFNANPEACGKACMDWYAEYAKDNYARPDYTNAPSNLTTDRKSFRNPVITADFPDPDVAHLGDTYYMLSTTMPLMPGATVLKSKDLVNWEYCANPLKQLSTADKYSLIDGKNSYAGGMWAGAITAHDGKLYILINGNDAGGFVLSTDDPEGKWDMKKLDRSYYDPGMIFEGDRIYVVCGIGNLSVCELDKDWNFIKSTTVIRDKQGLEGSHLYHIGDYYYIYSTYGGWPSGQTIFRSKTITGDYEERMLVEKWINGSANTVHQGALIETPTGEWWTMLMEDKGAIGRLPSLHPVTWADGWPTLCKNGVPQQSYTLPNVGTTYSTTTLPTNDNFRTYTLGKQWQWNHNAPDGQWSLLERPGYLRLYTSTVTDNMMLARGTLTQRIFAYYNTNSPYGLDTTRPSIGTVALDVRGMKAGDVAGIAVQQDPYAMLGVTRNDTGKYSLVWRNGTLTKIDDFTAQSKTIDDVKIDSVIYLRAQFIAGTSEASFYYSLDNKTWQALGEKTTLRYNLSVFVGARWAIFNYATRETGGRVDIDWFSTENQYDESTFAPAHFEGYSKDMLTMNSLALADSDQDMEIMVGTASDLQLTATFADGHTENVAAAAHYTIDSPELVSIANGRIKGLADGSAHITASYTDPLGNTLQQTFRVTSSFFPWASQFITTNLFGNGTYNAQLHQFKPSQWGQMGWVYQSGIDMSGYKYLVMTLDNVQTCSAALIIYTSSSIWGDNYRVDIGSSKRLVVNLKNLKYSGGDAVKGTPMDLSSVRMVALWSNGSGIIDLADAYLTNNDDYSRGTSTGIEAVSTTDTDLQHSHHIYDLQGRPVTSPSHGVYIIDGNKVWIK